MKPKKVRVPAVVHHRRSGRDVVFLRGPDGRRRTGISADPMLVADLRVSGQELPLSRH